VHPNTPERASRSKKGEGREHRYRATKSEEFKDQVLANNQIEMKIDEELQSNLPVPGIQIGKPTNLKYQISVIEDNTKHPEANQNELNPDDQEPGLLKKGNSIPYRRKHV